MCVHLELTMIKSRYEHLNVVMFSSVTSVFCKRKGGKVEWAVGEMWLYSLFHGWVAWQIYLWATNVKVRHKLTLRVTSMTHSRYWTSPWTYIFLPMNEKLREWRWLFSSFTVEIDWEYLTGPTNPDPVPNVLLGSSLQRLIILPWRSSCMVKLVADCWIMLLSHSCEVFFSIDSASIKSPAFTTFFDIWIIPNPDCVRHRVTCFVKSDINLIIDEFGFTNIMKVGLVLVQTSGAATNFWLGGGDGFRFVKPTYPQILISPRISATLFWKSWKT